MFEQFYARYEAMKQSIKDKIYDKLTVTIGLFKLDEVAEFVWNILKQFVFGSIDKLLTMIDTESNRQRLADIIFNEEYKNGEGETLYTQMNFNVEGESVNWYTVAKVAIMFIADIIWDTYIAGNGWVTDLFFHYYSRK